MERIYNLQDRTFHYYDDNGRTRKRDYSNLRGNIVVNDDGWFEGLLNSQFVFGIFHENEILELYFCPIYMHKKFTSSIPKVFHGKLSGKKFEGRIKELAIEDDDMLIHSITFTPSKLKGKYLESFMNLLERRKSTMGLACKEFYNNVYSSRKELDKLLVKNYVGVTYSDEDKQVARDINNQKRLARHSVRRLSQQGGR